jgi:hypothetical protein
MIFMVSYFGFIYLGKVFWCKRLRFCDVVLLPCLPLVYFSDPTQIEVILFAWRQSRQEWGWNHSAESQTLSPKNFASVNTTSLQSRKICLTEHTVQIINPLFILSTLLWAKSILKIHIINNLMSICVFRASSSQGLVTSLNQNQFDVFSSRGTSLGYSNWPLRQGDRLGYFLQLGYFLRLIMIF